MTKILKLGFVLMSIVLITLTSCEKEESDKSEESNTNVIVNNWKLVGLINISDQDKYLDAVLEIENNGNYTHTDKNGIIRTQGLWSIESDYLIIDSTLFGNGAEPRYRILKQDADSLKLEQHYTLDNKDAYLEYHYISLN